MIATATTAFWALVLVNLIWGVGFVVVDDAIEVMPVNIFNAFRFGIAALVLLPLCFINKGFINKSSINKSSINKKNTADIDLKHHNNKNIDGDNKGDISALFKIGFGLGLLLFLAFTFQTMGLLYTSVSNTGFITGLGVPLVPIIGFLLYKTNVGSEVWISVLVATLGLYFLTIGDKMEVNSGDILVAISAVCYATHITLMAKFGGRFAIIPLSVVQLSAVACFSTLAAIFEMLMEINPEYPPLIEQLSDSGVIGAILYSAILSSAFAYWVQTSSQRLIAPHKIALIFALEPLFAHMAAFFILQEYLGLKGWIGAGLIIAAMLYSELGGRKKVKIQPLDQMAAPLDK